MWKSLAVVLVLTAAPVGAQPSDGGTAAQTPDSGNVATRLIRDVASDYKNFLSVDTAQRITIGAFRELFPQVPPLPTETRAAAAATA